MSHSVASDSDGRSQCRSARTNKLLVDFWIWFGFFESMLHLNTDSIHLCCRSRNGEPGLRFCVIFLTNVSQHAGTAPVTLALCSSSAQAQQ